MKKCDHELASRANELALSMGGGSLVYTNALAVVINGQIAKPGPNSNSCPAQ